MRLAPYGAWASPITSELIVGGTVGLDLIQLDGEDSYWIEQRPWEQGRSVLVRRSEQGAVTDVTPAGFNVRNRVHEYGGGAYVVFSGSVWFTNDSDQRIYRQDRGGPPRAVTPALDVRYADGMVDHRRGRMIWAREDHRRSDREAVNTLVSLPLEGEEGVRVMAEGNDFYSSPRLSPDGSHLAWLTWNHPNMPWHGCELWLAEVAPDGGLRISRKLAGGENESIFQPAWSPLGVLYFVSDRSGWWNLYRWRQGTVEPVAPMEADFARAQWRFGMSTFAFLSEGQVACTVVERAMHRLCTLDLGTGRLQTVQAPYTTYLPALQARLRTHEVITVAGSPLEPASLVSIDVLSGRVEVMRRSTEEVPHPGYISIPETVEFPTAQGRTAFAFFYPPRNQDFEAASEERPPLIVHVHGGPTSQSVSMLNLEVQYWTSRGFALADVNYGGSTGFGREYWQRLELQWGVVDLDDSVNCARYLADRGLVDPRRLAITGGSAGGYTTLCALAFRDLFQAGASHFGISDLEVFHQDTHKFESRYDDHLLGPYAERRDIYRQRSPIHAADRIRSPLILFQGLEDRIVPPNQAELIVQALRRRGMPVAYIAFPGEQHGFRRAENIKRALDAELYFYARVFDIELPNAIEPVEIENLRR